MDSLPPVPLDFISVFRPLMRAEVFDSFTYLLCGLLIGEAKHGTVRASVFAPPDYQPQRLSDLFCCHKLSRQALMAQLTQGVLTTLYAGGLPTRLFWLADSTLTEKPFVRRVPPRCGDEPQQPRGAVLRARRVCPGRVALAALAGHL